MTDLGMRSFALMVKNAILNSMYIFFLLTVFCTQAFAINTASDSSVMISILTGINQKQDSIMTALTEIKANQTLAPSITSVMTTSSSIATTSVQFLSAN